MALGLTNILLSEIKELLEVTTDDSKDLFMSNNLNKYSRRKPVRYASVVSSDNIMQLTGFGFTLTSNPDLDNPTPWIYHRPSGGALTPYRLGDFAGYNHFATNFLWLEDTIWDYVFQNASDILLTPSFKFSYGSSDGQGGAGGGTIEIIPKDIPVYSGGSLLSDYYIGVYYKDSLGNTYYAYSNKKLGEVSSGDYLTVSFSTGENGSSSAEFINFLNSMTPETDIYITPFLCSDRNVSSHKIGFPSGEKVKFTKKNVHAEETLAMWSKLDIPYSGNVSFYNHTKSISLGAAPVYLEVTSSTPVSEVIANDYPEDILRVQLTGTIRALQDVTLTIYGVRLFVDGIGEGNYNSLQITIDGNDVSSQTSFSFTSGNTYEVTVVDYFIAYDNLLGNLPSGATYLNAAKPIVGLIKYDVVSFKDGSSRQRGVICIGKS